MKQIRLEQLTDGIFAIVMTILVFEIKVPELIGYVNEETIVNSLINMAPAFLSYLLSFSLLFTYWRSHHFIMSVLAKNIDTKFSNISGIFLFFVALTPFSAHLLSKYIYSETAIIFFAVNMILISTMLYKMRRYVIKSETIDNTPFTKIENDHAYMHILFPVFASSVAILVSFTSNILALFLFTLAILFNLSNKSTKILFLIINIFRKK
jgi:uncharacterized membrane protein